VTAGAAAASEAPRQFEDDRDGLVLEFGAVRVDQADVVEFARS
jgi:hypothetical protein